MCERKREKKRERGWMRKKEVCGLYVDYIRLYVHITLSVIVLCIDVDRVFVTTVTVICVIV